MSHRILITGASGYLGGTLLARLATADLPAYDKLYALVRTDEQAEAVARYGAAPLTFDIADEAAAYKAIVDNNITIVFYLIHARRAEHEVFLIKALAEVGRRTGSVVHFLHTSGAKVFSSHAGAPTDRPLLDDDPALMDVQKSQVSRVPIAQSAIEANNTIIEQGKALGVKTYIFVPCIVYGKGEGFGNVISIQTVAIVRAAYGTGRVYSVDDGKPTWPVCHISDNTTLYLQLLRGMLVGSELGHGEHGYYLAAPGSVAWKDIYARMAAALATRGVIDDATVERASDETLQAMATALERPKELVPFELGGLCTLTPRHGGAVGWTPEYAPEHILEAADEEVELILSTLKLEKHKQ